MYIFCQVDSVPWGFAVQLKYSYRKRSKMPFLHEILQMEQKMNVITVGKIVPRVIYNNFHLQMGQNPEHSGQKDIKYILIDSNKNY